MQIVFLVQDADCIANNEALERLRIGWRFTRKVPTKVSSSIGDTATWIAECVGEKALGGEYSAAALAIRDGARKTYGPA